ncbi:MAG TPA: GNAT family N-acetyltransferase [Cyclobacteriaceae bacterium]|jgi:ribosomal protein S18 acetylase RimI-like enzyme|nr:GNAT family N-acetyltransferase [Cyclobacteriaceae bacterium]
MKYRAGNSDDVAGLQKLALISYGQFQNTLTEENWNRLRAHIINESLFPNLLKTSKGFVCEHEHEIIGMAFLVPKGNPTEIFEEDWSYIRMVGVHPRFGGKGIGKTLTQMCIDFARSSGEKIIALHTSEFMNAARHIYENLGFKQIKELEPRYEKRYWIYKLEL